MTVYADHAASAPLRAGAMRAIEDAFRAGFGNPSSVHGPGRRARAALEEARERIARCLGAAPGEITFTSGGTEADNQALVSAAAYGASHRRRNIVSTAFEHHAVLHTLAALAQKGFSVTLLPIPADGIVTAEQVEEALREDTGVVSVMTANNEIGTIQPVREIGALCRARGILFHTDAVAAAGQIPVDTAGQNLDLLSLSAHKFGGPQGVGVLYARKGIPLTPLLYGGAQERERRAGTENLPGILGAAAALEEACRRMAEESAHVAKLRDFLMERLLTVPGAVLNGDRTRRLPGNVNVSFPGVEGEELVLLLDQRGIAASFGSACASGSLEPSHVLLALGRSRALARSSLRLTLGPENTETEAEYLGREIPEAVAFLRRAGGYA